MDASVSPNGGEEPSMRGAPIPAPATNGSEQTHAADRHSSQPYTPQPENGHRISTPQVQSTNNAPQVNTSSVPQCLLWPDGRYTWAQTRTVQVMANGPLNRPNTGTVQPALLMQPEPPQIQVVNGPAPYPGPFNYPEPPIMVSTLPPYGKRNAYSERGLMFQAVEQVARQLYTLLLLRIPPIYFSRIFKLFDRPEGPGTYGYEDKRYIPEDRWGPFVHAIIKEWETLNIVSVLALSAILTFLQLDGVTESAVIRTATLLSLIAAIWSLMFGCIYILRFGTMHTEEKARRWSKETRATKTNIFWNVWIMLAMPAVWLAWSIVAFCVAILAFIWTTGSAADNPTPPSRHATLGPRIAMSVFFALGLVYLIFVLHTFHMYADDNQWTVAGPNIPSGTHYGARTHYGPSQYHAQSHFNGGDQYQYYEDASRYYGGYTGYGSYGYPVPAPVAQPPVVVVERSRSRSPRSRRARTRTPVPIILAPRSRSRIRRRRRSPSRSPSRRRRYSRSRSHSRSRKETRFRSRSSHHSRGRTRRRNRTRSNSR
ncbi:hypothetical protein BD410DRAFT_793250 [Rickenella mellea]|uniref:Uncharacterized protein n=1 Tax=Rickenella mellea TaxID=50990 RepID=A0A4Y7PT28_9AGAM|nr:hypothetical protein BD410DRAFT_793250 [Rickenella mellea]